MICNLKWSKISKYNQFLGISAFNTIKYLSCCGLTVPGFYTFIPLCKRISPLGVRYKSTFTKKKKNLPTKVNSSTKVNRNKVVKTTTSGYIGSARFDLLSKIWEKQLPSLKAKGIEFQPLLDKTIEAHDKIISNHGVIEGTSKWKAITLYATGLLEGRNPDNPGWVATGKVNKWPRVLGHCLPVYIFVKDNIANKDLEKEVAESLRLLTTLFKLNKVCIGNSEIESHLVGLKKTHKLDPVLMTDFEKFARNRLSAVREGITLTDISFDLFLGPSNGPNSAPKLKFALEEAAVLEKDTILHNAFKELCIITDNKEFYQFFTDSAKNCRALELAHIQLRKLTTFPEKGNKSRLVALSDFWTQCVCAGIERSVLKVTLELFKNKCCFWSHSEGWETISQWPQEVQDSLVSLDATAWTDNFPASLQLIVVKALFGQRLADAWKRLVVTCPWHVPHMPKPAFYGKGQGMGTKASFAIAQLTDLIFVEYIYEKCYPNMIDPKFMKVGDDLVLQDPLMKFSKEYEEIGVPINLSKSKFKTSYGNFNEFVSRNSWNNNDYSLISPRLVSKFLRNDYYAIVLYDHIKERMDNHPPFPALLEMKSELDKTKSNFDLDKYQDRQRKLYNIITVLETIGEGVNLPPTHLWNPSKEEILLLLENLVLAFLGEMCLSTESLEKDLNPENTVLARDLWGEFMLMNERDHLVSDTKLFFKACNSCCMTFKEVIILKQALPILRSKEADYLEGQVINEIDNLSGPAPIIQTSCGTFIANPQFIDLYLRSVDQLGDSSLGYSRLKKGPLFSKSKTSNTLNLFSFLNKVVGLKSKILDTATGQLTLPKVDVNETIQLNPLHVGIFMNMFRIREVLSEIERIRSDESVEIQLFLLTTDIAADE
jgi:hypothetical protein